MSWSDFSIIIDVSGIINDCLTQGNGGAHSISVIVFAFDTLEPGKGPFNNSIVSSGITRDVIVK